MFLSKTLHFRLLQSTQLSMSTSIAGELTCNGLVSCPGRVIGSHPLSTTESGDRHRPCEPLGSGKDLALRKRPTLAKTSSSDIKRPFITLKIKKPFCSFTYSIICFLLSSSFQLSQRYLKQQKKPDFQNIKENLLEGMCYVTTRRVIYVNIPKLFIDMDYQTRL